MRRSAGRLRSATSEMANYALDIEKNGFSEPTKVSMLNTARAILESTVLMLQLADQFDVGQITRAGHLVEQEVGSTKGARSMPELVENSRALTHRALNLIQLAEERIGLLADPTFKRRLDTANATLRSDVEPYLNACKDMVSDNASNPAVRQRNEGTKRANAERIQAAVTEIILVCRLSQQHMWDKVSLDINALLRGRLPPLDLLKSIARDLDAEFDALTNALHNRNNPAADQALKGIQDGGNAQTAVALTMAEKADPTDKKGLMDALDRLERALRDLRDAANRKKDNPTTPPREYEKALEEAKAANRALVDAALAPEDRLLNAHDDIKKDLDGLGLALKNHNDPDAKQALRDLARDCQRANAVARPLAEKSEDPNARNALDDAYRRLMDALGKLGKNAPKAIERPNDPAAQKQAEEDVQEARDAAKALKEAALPPEKELAHKGEQLKQDMARLAEALQDGKKEEALPLMKSIPKDIEAQAERIRDFGKAQPDAPVQQEFKNYAEDLKALSPPLLQAARALIANRNDDPALNAYREIEDAINALNGKVSRRANDEANNRDKEGDLLKALERLRRALKNLLDDTKKEKQPEAIADVKEATQEMNREADLARQLAEKLPPSQKPVALAEAQKLKDLAPRLVADTKSALNSHADAPSMKQLEATVQAVNDAANKIPEVLQLSPDKQMRKHGRDLNEALDALVDAAKAGKPDDVKQLTAPQNIPKKMTDQAERAAKFAADADTPMRRKQLLADSDTLKRLPPPIVQAAQALAADPQNAQKEKALTDLVEQAKQANRRMMDPAYALTTPDQRVLTDIENIRQAARDGNVKETDGAVADLKSDVPEFVAGAQATVGRTNDPALKRVVAETAAEISALTPKVGPAARDAARNPHDMDLKRLNELLDKLRNLTVKLADAEINASTEKKIIDTAEEMEKKADTLHDAAKRGDRRQLPEHLQKLIEDLKKQAALAREMATGCDDPIRKKKFQDLGAAFEALIPRLQNALQRLVDNPYDLAAQKDLDQIMAEIKNLNDELIDTVRAENEAKLQKALERLQTAVEKGEDLTQPLKDVAELLKKHAIIARALAARTSDPKRKRELLQAAKDLEDAIKGIIDASRQGPAKLAEMTGRIMETAGSMKTLSSDPIMAAAEQIEQGLARKRKELGNQPEGSPAHRLLAGAARIAELMVLLSKAAKQKPMDKKEVILLSRQIAEAVNHVDKAARDVAATCKDTKLRESLLAYAAPLKNYGVQLKILTAVKASTSDDDKSTKQQLVSCAKGIANSVVSSCNAAEACLLKSG